MKTRILLFCISCLLWASCGNSGQNYVIEGTLPSLKYDGEWIYLVPMENAPGRVDSVKITNASFSFSGQGEEMRVLRLRHLLRMRKMVPGSLTEEQQKLLDESLQKEIH